LFPLARVYESCKDEKSILILWVVSMNEILIEQSTIAQLLVFEDHQPKLMWLKGTHNPLMIFSQSKSLNFATNKNCFVDNERR
jgi:hypothetical protein